MGCFRRSFFLFILSAGFIFISTAQDRWSFSVFQPSRPAHTELVSQKQSREFGEVSLKYKYLSELPAAAISEFYRQVMADNGFVEVEGFFSETLGDKGLFFTKGFLTRVVITIADPRPFPDKEEVQTPFYVNVNERADFFYLSEYKFRRPQRLDGLPVYKKAHQYFNKEIFGGSNTSYLVKGTVEEAVAFYKTEMPKFKWIPSGSYSRRGLYNVDEAITDKTSSQEIFDNVGLDKKDFYPGLDVNVEGATLIYTKSGEACTIVINKFTDTPAVLSAKRIDPEPFKQYGNVMVNIIIQDAAGKKAVEDSFRKNAPYLRYYLKGKK